jgi:HPt (histidine-containing phosphotransfer) domain-containing protein
MSSSPTVDMGYLYSSLANDPDLAEIVDMFIDEMPGRVQNLTNALADENWVELGRYAHQMKGACGSYGFDRLSESAARLERACRPVPCEEQIRAAVEELTALCQSVRRGSGI